MESKQRVCAARKLHSIHEERILLPYVQTSGRQGEVRRAADRDGDETVPGGQIHREGMPLAELLAVGHGSPGACFSGENNRIGSS